MTNPTHEELERLAKAASPGAWEFVEGGVIDDAYDDYGVVNTTCRYSGSLTIPNKDNAKFIAAANPQAILDLLSELARVRGLLQRQWISVEERLPQDNVQVLVDGGIAVHYGDSGWWTRMDRPERPITWKVTHWMPVPKLDEPITDTPKRDALKVRFISKEEVGACKTFRDYMNLYGFNGCKDSTEVLLVSTLAEYWYETVLPSRATFQQSSSLAMQGAESADIGKLGTADKAVPSCSIVDKTWHSELYESGVEMGKVNRVEEKGDV